MTIADEIGKLNELRQQGVITAEEFDAQKARLLALMEGRPEPQGAMSTLAILALVFAFVFGPVGLLLGIIALILIGTSKGKLRGKGIAIAAICVSIFFWGIVVYGVVYRAFDTYMQKAKTSEATLNIDRIYEGAVTYFEAEHVDQASGTITTHRFPASTDWTPAVSCCEQGGAKKCDAGANMAAWDTETWKALDFSMGDNFYYQYRFVVDGNTAYAQAQGDLDCDGEYSLFERAMEVAEDGTVRGSSGVYKRDPLE